MTTEIDRLGARLRFGWVSLLAAAGCTGSGPVAGTSAGEAKVETKVEAKVDPALAAEAARKAEMEALEREAKALQARQAALEAELKAAQDKAAAEKAAAEAAKLAEEAAALQAKLREAEAKHGVTKPTKPPDVVTKLPSCPNGDWSGPAALAKKLAGKDSTLSEGCPRFINRIAQKFSDEDAKGLEGLPQGATGTLDVKKTQKAPGTCAYDWVIRCPGGRVLIDGGEPVRAGTVADAAWLGEVESDAVDGELAALLAAGWTEDARTEHASIASFARATLELLALAAPPALVIGAQQASLDEVEHARVCFALASRYAGSAVGPGPLPATSPRAADLVRLACDTFVEGCVGETIAALAAMRAARDCGDAAVRAALERIADDEARHAALAWGTIGWACERGGAAVRDAVCGLAAAMRDEVNGAPTPARSRRATALARHGRLDAAAQHACAVDAWATLIPGALDELLGAHA